MLNITFSNTKTSSVTVIFLKVYCHFLHRDFRIGLCLLASVTLSASGDIHSLISFCQKLLKVHFSTHLFPMIVDSSGMCSECLYGVRVTVITVIASVLSRLIGRECVQSADIICGNLL